jgi:hypothetical protein
MFVLPPGWNLRAYPEALAHIHTEAGRNDMTNLLEEAIRRVSELPEGQQDVVASLVIAEIEAEDIWDSSLAVHHDLLEDLESQGFVLGEADEARLLGLGDA